MTAPAHTTKETLIVLRRPLKKASSLVVCVFSITLIQSKQKVRIQIKISF